MMIQTLINDSARKALIAEGANGDLEEAGNGLYWLPLSEDVWQELLRRMAGEWELTETAEEEAKCLSDTIIRQTSKQTGTA